MNELKYSTMLFPIQVLPLLWFVVLPSWVGTEATLDDCDIIEFYERADLDSGSKSIGAYGGIEDAEAVLIPTSVEEGNYEVTVRRIDQNFYQINGTSIVIETRYCNEYSTYGTEAVMMVESNYGYTKGTIIFE